MAASQPVGPPRFAGKLPQTRVELLAAPLRWPRPSILESPLRSLDGIGAKLSEAAAEAGVETIADLLWRVPRTYNEPAGLKRVADLTPGEPALVAVEVLSSRRVRVRRRGFSVVEAKVADESGPVKAVWFNQAWVEKTLVPGSEFRLQGRLEKRGFTVSDMEIIGAAGPPGIGTGAPLGRHPATGALRPARWRRWVWQALRYVPDVIEPVPSRLLSGHRFAGSAASIKAAHFPADRGQAELARRRLAWEELLLHQVVIRRGRVEARRRLGSAPVLDADPELTEAWLEGLPFDLTGDQRRALVEIGQDISSVAPMRRLLMGEVGSGKTVVALWAMLRAVDAGGQAALMAPTGVLAEQHAATLIALLGDSGVGLGLLTGSTPASARRELRSRLDDGRVGIVVGTHALLEPEVSFRRLALCVVDEEHRFGVEQRRRLDAKAPKGKSAHVLSMTATPIPRTLALTAYGDLEVTALRELPRGRKPVATKVLGPERSAEVFAVMRDQLDASRQAFVVCPLVEASEEIQARAAAEEAERLRAGELSDYEVGLLHGGMSSEQKEIAMAAFADGRTDVLVATTVVEVGIDVANATMIVVEGAERFGLSTLHQLRGRVGRGDHPGMCFLVSSARGESARRRLVTLENESDGFRLAEADLSMRGEGELSGTRQSGLPAFRVARLPDDRELLESACMDVESLLDEHGSLEAPELAPLADLAGRRFGPESIGHG